MAEILNIPYCNKINIISEHNACYLLYDAKRTTLKKIINTLYQVYSEIYLNKMNIYSEEKEICISQLDINKSMDELNFGQDSKFVLKNIENNVEYKDQLYQSLKENESDTQIFIRTVVGKTISIYVYPNLRVGTLKELIKDKENIPVDHQRLIFCGWQLEDDKKLSDYGIDRHTIHLVCRLKGGMFHETSGRNGNYEPLESNVHIVSPDININQ